MDCQIGCSAILLVANCAGELSRVRAVRLISTNGELATYTKVTSADIVDDRIIKLIMVWVVE